MNLWEKLDVCSALALVFLSFFRPILMEIRFFKPQFSEYLAMCWFEAFLPHLSSPTQLSSSLYPPTPSEGATAAEKEM